MLFLPLSLLLLWISYVDLARREIPDLAVAGVAGLGLFDLWGEVGAIWDILAAVLLFATLWLFGEIAYRRSGHEALGAGDAKLFGAGALLVGWAWIPIFILLACLGGIVFALVKIFRNVPRRDIPFGPFIAYALLITLVLEGR